MRKSTGSTALREEIVRANGIAMNVASGGEGPVALLLHGFPDTHAVWRKQIDALIQAGYRVVAPDLRGYGKTEAPEGVANYRLEVLRDDVLALLDAMKIDRVYLIGHDWGSIIGWQLCLHAPERVERFAALSVGHPAAYVRAGVGQLLMAWYAVVFQLPLISEMMVKAGDLALLKLYRADDEQLADWRANFAGRGRITAALNYYRANLKLAGAGGSNKTPTKVLGVWSKGDPALTEAQMRDSAKYVTGGFEYARIDDKVGHWMQLAAPERVNKLLLTFGPNAG
jgi:pimeloyl-ACP methyl ester carboxylesterase